jgi:hypothetical protein
MAILSADEAVRRISTDRLLLSEVVVGPSDDDLVAPYRVRGGPLGDACESLRDLIAHVLMWDEISLAVLTDAAFGRTHWSLEPRWETRAAGQRLNAAGVAAGRELPVDLLKHRFSSVGDSLLAEIERGSAEGWTTPLPAPIAGRQTRGALAQYIMTVPTMPPYWHAAIHLGSVPEAGE